MSTKINMLSLQRMANSNIASNAKKIDSPLAKYDNLGRLWCKICNYHVKIETLWASHVSSNTHKKMVEDLKNVFHPTLKSKKLLPNLDVPKKSILKRKADESCVPLDTKRRDFPPPSYPQPSSLDRHLLPPNFFDEPPQPSKKQDTNESIKSNIDNSISLDNDMDQQSDIPFVSLQPFSQLPKGFFDDPDIDAKMRGVKLPQEVFEDEWKLFQKVVVKEETKKSDVFREIEDFKTNAHNEIVEIDEQIEKWSQVEFLHMKKEVLVHPTVLDEASAAAQNKISRNLTLASIPLHLPVIYVPRKNMLFPNQSVNNDDQLDIQQLLIEDLIKLEDELWRSKGIL